LGAFDGIRKGIGSFYEGGSVVPGGGGERRRRRKTREYAREQASDTTRNSPGGRGVGKQVELSKKRFCFAPSESEVGEGGRPGGKRPAGFKVVSKGEGTLEKRGALRPRILGSRKVGGPNDAISKTFDREASGGSRTKKQERSLV